MRGGHNNHKIRWADMTEEVLSGTAFFQCILNHQADRAQHIIGGDESIRLPKRIQMVDTDMEKSPSALMDHVGETLLHKCTFRQAADRICEGFLADSLQSIAYA